MDASSNGPSKPHKEQLLRHQWVAQKNLVTSAVDLPDATLQRSAQLLDSIGVTHQFGNEGKAHAHGGVGLLTQHTSFFDGFAVLLSMPHNTGVVIRSGNSKEPVILFDDVLRSWDEENQVADRELVFNSMAGWQQLIQRLLLSFVPASESERPEGLCIAISSSIPPGCVEAFWASLAMSFTKAIHKYYKLPEPVDLIDRVRWAIEGIWDSEFSKAFLLVSGRAEARSFCILDTATEELISFPLPANEHLAWGLLDPGKPARASFYEACSQKGLEALEVIKNNPQAGYASYRDIPHADLARVLSLIPKRYRTIVKHLVNENKRVQAMIGAIRRDDWQLLGGLLFISHASLRDDLGGTSKSIDFVVDEAEKMSSDGILGACMTGRSGFVVLVGLPLVLPGFMEKVKVQLKEKQGYPTTSLIL